nr:ABC transporter permease [Geothrix sp. SG10]
MAAEGLKLRRSVALRLVWLLPLLFLLFESLVIERTFLSLRVLTPKLQATFDLLQVKMVVALWGGFFHPLMLALLPALLFRPEHRFKTWRHLYAMPMSRRGIFLAKAISALLLSAAMLALISLLLAVERKVFGWINPLLAFPFHGLQMAKALGWLWLGSLPVMALYLWVSDRINSLAVPVVFGLVGLLLTMSLTGQELPQPWRRDLIPWVLPYAAAEQMIRSGPAQQQAHLAGSMFQPEKDVLRLPSGKKVRTWQNIPDEVLFPPPPPTPRWVLATFSLVAGAILLSLGYADAGRNRNG